MSHASRNKTIRVVILGAGFGGVYAFRHLHGFFHQDPTVELTLVNRHNYFLFTPLLHEVATGGIAPENILEPLRKTLGCCLSEFYLADVIGIEFQNRCVVTTAGALSYDYLVVALGGRTEFHDVPGAEQHSFTLKSLEDGIRLKNHFIETFERASKIKDEKERRRLLHFAIIGGGPTGVELAAEMSEFFCQTFAAIYPTPECSKPRITLLQRQNELLPQFSTHLRRKAQAALIQKGVDVRLGVSVAGVTKDHVQLADGERIPTSTAIWVAGTRPERIAFDHEPECDRNGRLLVESTLQLQGHSNVFVLGDMAAFRDGRRNAPLPPLAQVATRQAAAVADNIHNLIRDREPRGFVYKHAGDLVSLGHWMALGELHGIRVCGHMAWWLWRTVYLSKLLSWQKKLKVALDWTVNLSSPRDVSRLYHERASFGGISTDKPVGHAADFVEAIPVAKRI